MILSPLRSPNQRGHAPLSIPFLLGTFKMFQGSLGPDNPESAALQYSSTPSLQFSPHRRLSEEHAKGRGEADDGKDAERNRVTFSQIVKESGDDWAHESAHRGDAPAHALNCSEGPGAEIIGTTRLLHSS